ncbi:DUF2490 domain-containing protein [Hymenobacter jeollabukensis]|uniref:DUF2490 domain-containing protein n=1 Tax=Hymenobacter jeollabukensis TaxID=2025313 RepID=A0A5R8WMD8_9BACT|nr:DUF2490 domain-containing protein [Hymenobacter jeollabukensis]TLM90585.1 DUF2490 domain-containing protein [Hymenobacter jeollabukensis]
MTALFRATGPLLAFFLPLFVAAQQLPEARVAERNDNLWLVGAGQLRLTDKWSSYAEMQLRRADQGRKPQQTVLRLAANYHLGQHFQLGAGALYQKIYPYGQFAASESAPEHGFYQQVQVQDVSGRVQLLHRYRLEQRWIRWPEANRFTYQNRTRYQLGLLLPLLGPRLTTRMPYLIASDEILVNFGRNAPNRFDQNRLYAGLGYTASKLVRLEAGYLNQLLQQRNGRVFEHNHTLQLSLLLNLDLRADAPMAAPLPPGY